MPTTRAVAKRYYPKLSDVITIDDMPEFLAFAKEGLNIIFGKIHYKNLQYSKSYRGDSAFYSLDIVSKDIGINLPFGLRFVLNPDAGGDSAISSFPITLEYQWEILAFLHAFKFENFSFSPEAFYELGLQIFRVSEDQILAHTLNYFVETPDDTTTKFERLVSDINDFYPSAGLSLPPNQEQSVSTIVDLINQNANIPKSVSATLFAVYLFDSNVDETKRKLQQFYNSIIPEGIEEYIRKLIVPKAKATLQLSAAIEFPNTILQPVDADGDDIVNTKTQFKFGEAVLLVDTEAGISYQAGIAGTLNYKSRIGKTGLIIDFEKARLDLSRTTNIPEADAAGYSNDFTGLYIQQASITLSGFGKNDTSQTSASIVATNVLIGTGGFSGTLSLVSDGAIYRKFGEKFKVELNEFSINFLQNSITNSSISGKLTLPGYKSGSGTATIDIDAALRDNGDFHITANFNNALGPLELENVFQLHIRNMTFGNQDDHFFVGIAGRLDFIADLPGGLGKILPQNIELEKLIIWDNGRIDFDGGNIEVSKAFKIKLGPAVLEVTKMSLGAHKRTHNGIERHYTFFGFDGMLNTGNAGVNVSGNGLKYYFTTDGGSFDHYFSIDSIAIDLSIPNENPAITLKGFLSVNQPTSATSLKHTEYTGAVDFTLPKLKFGGSAGMRLTPSIPAFVVDIGLELATPIPLGATGLGIYGFRGLIGQHYMPDKSAVTPPLPESATWYDYYKAPSTITGREGVEIDKFGNKPGFSMGAGISLATNFDSGKAFSSKVFLLLGLPDVFLIQGQAAMLRSRIGLDEDVDPPFTAVIIFGDKSVRGNLSVNYQLPESSGDIMSLQGALDFAFFFNNASGWYLNLGKDTPENERIRARILTLFNAYSYLMLSSRGIKAGAGTRFDFNKKFGPVAVGLGAYIDLGGFINFKPVQIGGFINLGGYAYVKVWKFKLGFSIAAGLAVEAPHPFNISGFFELSIKVPFKRIRVRVDLSWRINNNDAPLRAPVPILGLPDSIDHLNSAPGYLPAVAVNIHTNQTFQLNYVNDLNLDYVPSPWDGRWRWGFFNADQNEVTIPLDSFIDIELLKPVKPGNSILGGASNQLPDGYMELFPPQKGLATQIKHQYELSNIEILIWKDYGSGNGNWETYNIYEAATAIASNNNGVTLGALKQGYWQFNEPNKFNKLRLLSQNMFSYTAKTVTNYSDLDARDFSQKDVFCFDQILKKNYINWQYEPENTVYNNINSFYINGYSFNFSGLNGIVKEFSPVGKVLQLDGYHGTIEINLPAALSFVELEFLQNQHFINVDYIRLIYKPISYVRYETRVHRILNRKFTRYIPVVENYIIQEEEIVSSKQAVSESPVITYDNGEAPITKLRINFSPNISYHDYNGHLVLGGHYPLSEQFNDVIPSYSTFEKELPKSLLFVTIYNKSFNSQEVLVKNTSGNAGTVASWDLTSGTASTGSANGFTYGNPDLRPSFFKNDSTTGHYSVNTYRYEGLSDAMFIPFADELKVENGNFAFEATILFNPFSAGSITIMSKVFENGENGYKKGFSLHLIQGNPGISGKNYTNASLPSFLVMLVVYNGFDSSAVFANEKYTLDCTSNTLTENQYKNIFVSVNRDANKLDIYIDRVLKKSTSIPSELPVTNIPVLTTKFKQLTYLGEALQERVYDIEPTVTQLVDEVQLLNDGINKLLQPVWRPNSIYAIKVTTIDRVNGVANLSTKTFGFKTAGPIGHFHLQNKKYLDLQSKERSEEFKLDSLKHYIDYERSYPDAQSRFDISKPVYCDDPQVRLFFTQPYINVMFSNWDNYKGIAAVESKLEILLTDTSGNVYNQQLVWEQLPEIVIDDHNVDSLPPDMRIIYQLNKAAAQGCNPMNTKIKKRLKTGVYKFDTLEPQRLYTAIFNSMYKPGTEILKSEVHKLIFKTSRYYSFEHQISSFITDVNGVTKYLIYKKNVGLDNDTINQLAKPLLNDTPDDDPQSVLKYAVQFDRMVFGALALKSFEESDNSVIEVIINSSPDNPALKKILGIIFRCAEPINDPKLPKIVLNETVGMRLTTENNTIIEPQSFIYIHSRDNSAVFISNSEMNIPLGQFKLSFKYKLFNGIEFITKAEYTTPSINIGSFL